MAAFSLASISRVALSCVERLARACCESPESPAASDIDAQSDGKARPEASRWALKLPLK